MFMNKKIFFAVLIIVSVISFWAIANSNLAEAANATNTAQTENQTSWPGKIWGRYTNWTRGFGNWFAGAWGPIVKKVGPWVVKTTIKQATFQIQGPNGSESVTLPTDVVACEFYQKNKKLVTCAAYKAADTFCTQVMQSRHAKAVMCQEDGLVVCTNPCTPPDGVAQVPIKQCAFDNDRTRGKQAPPFDFCNETVTAKMPSAQGTGSKKAGEVCLNGGECQTGYCLGQPSDNGIKYFCSCSQSKHDTSCNK